MPSGRREWLGLVLGILYLVIGAASWCTGSYIETVALRGPDHAIGPRDTPLRVKGVVRYVTASEALSYRIALVVFLGDIAGFGLVALVTKSRRRDRKGSGDES
jgi:hypothetical protein